MNRSFLIIAGSAVLAIALGIALYPKPAASSEDSGAPPAAAGPGSAFSSGGSATATPAATGADAGGNTRLGPSNKPEPPKHKAPAPPVYPTATAVPNKEGFVLSPYNNKVVDVTGIPSGKLVADPTYPTDEKKFFRVP